MSDKPLSLLFITQKVSSEDPVLGFVHGWLLEFAKEMDVTVICLERGPHRLPKNVRVFSLGKERGLKRFGYLRNFYRLIWEERKRYGAVFVHMNPEYVLLGGLLWRLSLKKVMLWYNHEAGGVLLRIAAFFSNKVLHTSPYAYPARFGNALTMPAGIDTKLFSLQTVPKVPRSILFLGRISPIKHIELLIEAGKKLRERHIDCKLSIYGNAGQRDEGYRKELVRLGRELTAEDRLVFRDGIPNYKAPQVYSAHEVFVNLSPSGLFDKTILEALASETLVLVSSKAFTNVLPSEYLFREGDVEDLTEKMRSLLELSPQAKLEHGKQYRKYVEREHSLEELSGRLVKLYQ